MGGIREGHCHHDQQYQQRVDEIEPPKHAAVLID
jgi:hypothetical protein